MLSLASCTACVCHIRTAVQSRLLWSGGSFFYNDFSSCIPQSSGKQYIYYISIRCRNLCIHLQAQKRTVHVLALASTKGKSSSVVNQRLEQQFSRVQLWICLLKTGSGGGEMRVFWGVVLGLVLVAMHAGPDGYTISPQPQSQSGGITGQVSAALSELSVQQAPTNLLSGFHLVHPIYQKIRNVRQLLG